MLDQASAVGTARPVQWQQDDALALSFSDGEFDAVVCQFGAMFFPGKAEATDKAATALAQRFGPNAVDGKTQALVVTVEK